MRLGKTQAQSLSVDAKFFVKLQSCDFEWRWQ